MSVDGKFQNRFAQLYEARRQLDFNDGNGTSGGMSDDWKANVDRQLGQLHGDVRNLLYGLIGGFLVLAAGGITAYVQLESKFDTRLVKVEDRLTSIERKVDTLDAKIDILLGRQLGGAAK